MSAAVTGCGCLSGPVNSLEIDRAIGTIWLDIGDGSGDGIGLPVVDLAAAAMDAATVL